MATVTATKPIKKPGLIDGAMALDQTGAGGAQALDAAPAAQPVAAPTPQAVPETRDGPHLESLPPPSATEGPAALPGTGGPAPPPPSGIVNSVMAPNGTSSEQTQPTGSPTSTSPGVPSSSVPGNGTGISAVHGTVDENQTVQGQIQSLLREGSPILAAARQRAQQYAASRGLVNGTMAAQAGEEAALSAAVPIATSDAGTFSRQSLVNQDADNQFRSQDKSILAQQEAANRDREWQGGEHALDRTHQTSLAAAENQTRERIAAQQAGAQAADAAARLSIAREDIASRDRISARDMDQRMELASLDRTTRMDLANIDVNSRRELNMSNLQQNTLNNYGSQITSILGSQMEQEDKERAIRNLNAVYGGSPYLPVTINWQYKPPGG